MFRFFFYLCMCMFFCVLLDIWFSSMILYGWRIWYYIIVCFLVLIMGCCLIFLMCVVEVVELYFFLCVYLLLLFDYVYFKVIVYWDCGWEVKSWIFFVILRRLIYYYSSKLIVKFCWVKMLFGEKNGLFLYIELFFVCIRVLLIMLLNLW